ncbi:unnamed protein product [Effrenium voratum]|uniref:Uncharacterized protein n=1 Tax=Effrenium voratum TaxID=2562239 RepID=A0AA36N4V7_9DINO|nr:unnamed protein product [Effrenium voratum]CAJ1428879.1 unnamed protein product [Effrenium voratum]
MTTAPGFMCFPWLCCLVVAATTLSDTALQEAPEMMLLQTRLAREPTGVCVPPPNMAAEAYTLPIERVVEAFWPQDGFCVFGGAGAWARECANSRIRKDISNFVQEFGFVSEFFTAPSATPFTFRLPDGRAVTTRDHVYPLDDVYCLVNGWYDLDAEQLLHNFSFLEEASDRACAELEQLLPSFHSISMLDLTVESFADEKALQELMANDSNSAEVTEAIVHGMRVHAAAKCLLRGPARQPGAVQQSKDKSGGKGALCDVSNCASRSRLVEWTDEAPKSGCGHLLQEGLCAEANACACHTHAADCYVPIPLVMQQHPHTDGFCYFNGTAFYVSFPGTENMSEVILAMRGSDYKGLNTGPLVTYKFDGREISSYMDASHYLYDDLYGFSLGFLQGQGLRSDWMLNSSRWTQLSEQMCNNIQQEFNFSNHELVLSDWLDYNAVIAVMTACSAGMPAPGSSKQSVLDMAGWQSPSSCRPVSRRDFAKHHYVKCILGYRNSAMDMAYLNSRACLLEGNRIGHLSECPYSPEMTS